MKGKMRWEYNNEYSKDSAEHSFRERRKRNHEAIEEAAMEAQRELKVDVTGIEKMERPEILTEEQWRQVQKRAEKLKRKA